MGLFKDAMRKGIPGRDAGASMARTMQAPSPPRPTLIQGGPAYFTPEGYRPPMQPQQAFMPTDTMGDPIGDMFRRQLPPVRIPGPPPMKNPPRDPRDEFISIGGVGGKDGIDDPRMEPMPEPIDMPQPVFLGDPNQPITGGPAPTPPGMGGGFGSIFDNVREFMKNNPDKVNRGGGMLGKTDPNALPLEDRGYGPGITVNPDFMEDMMRGGFKKAPPPIDPRDNFISYGGFGGFDGIDPNVIDVRTPDSRTIAPPREMRRDMPPSFENMNMRETPLQEPIAMPRNPEMVADIQRRMALPPMMPELMDPSMDEPMPMMPQLMPEPMPIPMQPRMQMPGPIATPTPRLQRPSLPMMPMMGGRGRR